MQSCTCARISAKVVVQKLRARRETSSIDSSWKCASRRGKILFERADLRTPMAVEWLFIFGTPEEAIEDEDMAVWAQH